MVARRLARSTLVTLAAAPLALAACGIDRALPVHQPPDLTVLPDLTVPPDFTPPPDLTLPDMAQYRDLAVGNDLAQLPGYPAPHPPLAEVVTSGGPVLRAPEVTVITFPGDTQQAAIETFTSRMATSRWWLAVASEYGVGPCRVRPPIHLAEAAPRVIDDSEIGEWLVKKIESKAPGFGTATADSLFMIFYPARVSVTENGAMSCVDFGAYHNSTVLGDGTPVAYGVMPRCSAQLDALSVATSHELVEAGTDPQPLIDPAYFTTALRDRGWSQVFHGGEVADMCQWEQGGYVTPEIGREVTRSWSNAAARIDHDPCVPDDSDRFYFNSAPVLPDGNPILQLQEGVPRTFEVDLFSTGPTGAWEVAAETPRGVDSDYTWDFKPSTGKNGDKLMLTVTLNSLGSATAHNGFVITSTLGGRVHYWPVGVRGRR